MQEDQRRTTTRDGLRKNATTGRPLLSAFDRGLSRYHEILFMRHPVASLAATSALYVAVVLAFGPSLAVSCNYFIILPVLAAALAFQLPGGIVAGLLGLPSNLLLFALIGHPEFSPASKPIAELSGILVGSAFGYLADYFRKLEAEIERRAAVEESLRIALAEKEVLVREVHHRVRNNLTIIKSLVQLQKNRSRDPLFLAAANDLLGRVSAIAIAHEQVYGPESLILVDLSAFVSSLLTRLGDSVPGAPGRLRLERGPFAEGLGIPPDHATPLALILNEAITNARRHAFGGVEEPLIRVSLELEGPTCVLAIADNGRGLAGAPTQGLGLKMALALAGQMDGQARLLASAGGGAPAGARFELRFHAVTLPPRRQAFSMLG